jgi:hypothetical protein
MRVCRFSWRTAEAEAVRQRSLAVTEAAAAKETEKYFDVETNNTNKERAKK